jgi:hypothetical protein
MCCLGLQLAYFKLEIIRQFGAAPKGYEWNDYARRVCKNDSLCMFLSFAAGVVTLLLSTQFLNGHRI